AEIQELKNKENRSEYENYYLSRRENELMVGGGILAVVGLVAAIIKGPMDSPFQDALFTLDISYPAEYPFHPPKVKFDDKIFHPNVDINTGEINPNPDDPINFEAARILKEDEQRYNDIVKIYIKPNIVEYSVIFEEVSKLLEPLKPLLSCQEIQVQTTSFFGKLVEKERLKNQYEQKSSEVQALHRLVFPNSPYNFSQLYSEVQRLKTQDLVSQINKQEEELEIFVQQLKIGREKVRALCRIHQKLIRVKTQENFDQNVVELLEDEIDEIKDKLLSGGWFTWKVSLENT
ncbi:17764_t:CDS:2, partial [Cetraspora pellucida]